ncbi:MAG: hypothetical protein AB1449_00400 [Chloroflexota bacterium]
MTSEPSIAQPAPGDRVTSWIRRALRLLLRLLVAVVLGAALGAAAYYGAPAVYRHYIEPVQVNSQRLTDLEQAFRQEQESNRQDQATLAERLTQLESQLAAQAEALAALQAQVDRQDQDLETLAGLSTRVGDLEDNLDQALSDVAELQRALTATDAPTQQLARQLQLIRAMELLTRARLWLTQSNLGLAASDIENARQALRTLAAAAPEDEAASLRAIADRLDLALTDLQTSPVVAADDLEIAWRLLLAATSP